jgi:hypothetical protein
VKKKLDEAARGTDTCLKIDDPDLNERVYKE